MKIETKLEYTGPTPPEFYERAKVEIEGLKRWLDFKQAVRVTPELLSGSDCGCFGHVGFADETIGVVASVCERHAKYFGIHHGPYWEEDLELDEVLRAHSLHQKHLKYA